MADSAHFKDKTALEHVIEAQAKGILASSESHGSETPGHFSAAADAARETGLLLLIFWSILVQLAIPSHDIVKIMAVVACGWLIWKMGRSAWLQWTRLERLHRIMAEERWEIEHHRQQERDELTVLYEAKGFQGKLLEDVVDVLMSDGDRLLKVMVEEELGLSLEVYEHPLKQGLGAAIGAFIAGLLCVLTAWLSPAYGIFFGVFIVIGSAAGVSAYLERNRIIPAVVWNIGIAVVAFSFTHFLLAWLGYGE